MNFTPVRTHIFKEGDDLPRFMVRYIPSIAENTIVVVSSKLTGLWKKRTVPYQSKAQKEKLIKQESSAALKTPLAWLTIREGMVMTNSGIDESNADGKLILLPQDCFACARELRNALKPFWKVSNFGIIITDSMILPLRAGVIGAAVGYDGFKGVKDLRGQKDIFGKPLQTTLVDAADSLAAAAAVTMGEAAEKSPLCVVQDAPVMFTEQTDPQEIKYPAEDDLYTPLLKAVKLIK